MQLNPVSAPPLRLVPSTQVRRYTPRFSAVPPKQVRPRTQEKQVTEMSSDTKQPKAGDTPDEPVDFIRAMVQDDVDAERYDRPVATRFPPEPNGYLHIGHAKSICLNFGVAKEFGGTCNLRFDDTNPTAEEVEYVESIKDDVRWLGFEWDNLHFASDYFEQLYEWAIHLIENGDAYVDSLGMEEIREYRGPWNEPGRDSPYRERSVEENLDLFRRMRAGEFEDGAHVLRAKIDNTAPNMNLRDPILYRIRPRDAPPHGRRLVRSIRCTTYARTAQSDAIEGHHALTLHARVRRPPSAVRLVPGAPAGAAPAGSRSSLPDST